MCFAFRRLLRRGLLLRAYFSRILAGFRLLYHFVYFFKIIFFRLRCWILFGYVDSSRLALLLRRAREVLVQKITGQKNTSLRVRVSTAPKPPIHTYLRVGSSIGAGCLWILVTYPFKLPPLLARYYLYNHYEHVQYVCVYMYIHRHSLILSSLPGHKKIIPVTQLTHVLRKCSGVCGCVDTKPHYSICFQRSEAPK